MVLKRERNGGKSDKPSTIQKDQGDTKKFFQLTLANQQS